LKKDTPFLLNLGLWGGYSQFILRLSQDQNLRRCSLTSERALRLHTYLHKNITYHIGDAKPIAGIGIAKSQNTF